MERTMFGDTDLFVSRVCLGTMTFGSQVDQSAAATMLDFCLDHGINFVDTANVYNQGASEEILGRVLQGRRWQVVLASKVGNKMGDEPDQFGLSKAAIVRQIDQSLRRLRTDYLDIYYLHQPDYSTPLDETLEAIAHVVREGKARHIGASNYASWQVCQMLWRADKDALPRVRITQPMYNLLARNVEREFLPMCRALNLATVVYNPLAGGLLTGKHSAERPAGAGTRFDGNQAYQRRYWHPQNFAAVEQLAQAAAVDGRSLVSLALGWLWHHAQADCLVLGASRLEQLEENIQAVQDGPLSDGSIEMCERVWHQLRGVSADYNR